MNQIDRHEPRVEAAPASSPPGDTIEIVELEYDDGLDAFAPEPDAPPGALPRSARASALATEAVSTPSADPIIAASATSTDDDNEPDTPIDDDDDEMVSPVAQVPDESVPALAIARPAPLFAVTVEDVLARQVPLEWFEAVAVVQEFCAVAGAGRGAIAVPEPSAILLTRDGAVIVRGGSSTESVRRVDRLLHALLANAAGVPAPLRLFVAAAGDAYVTVADFASALGYFGRPGRRELIRAVYERCIATPTRPAAEQPQQTTPTATLPPRPRDITPAWIAIPIAVACLLFAALWAWPPTTLSGVLRWPLELPNVKAPAPTKTVRALVSPAAKTDTPVPPARAAVPVPRSNPNRTRKTLAPPVLAIPRRAVPVFEPRSPIPSKLLPPVTTPRVVAPAESVAVDASYGDAPVYSSVDGDVRPPTLVFPQLPQPVLPEFTPLVNTMELLIGTDGSVEEVRLLTRPRRMPDMMILSGAKMWRFEPASRGGVPVKYRTVISWTVTP